MAKKKAKVDPVANDTAEKPVRKGRSVNVWISPRHARALDDYLNSVRPTPTLVATVELALEKIFEEAGFWPPPTEDRP